MDRCYRYFKDINDLADGRPYKYMAHAVKIPREHMSLILRGKRLCTYEEAMRIVTRFNKTASLYDYFVKVKGEG